MASVTLDPEAAFLAEVEAMFAAGQAAPIESAPTLDPEAARKLGERQRRYSRDVRRWDLEGRDPQVRERLLRRSERLAREFAELWGQP